MRAFACDNCGQLLFFENSVCLRCGSSIGFLPDELDLVVLGQRPTLRVCANQRLAECNWLLTDSDREPEGLCASCRLTRTRPPDTDDAGLAQFARAEAAKRRLLYQLFDLHLPVSSELQFDLLSSTNGQVMTGHDNGIITLDLAESDDARRAQRQAQLAEPYRTLLGHFRHEIGHYYEPILVDETGHRDDFRTLFGDERADYQEALDRHYEQGPPPDWEERHVSSYATMHPWEDWAETFAHYLHIRDTLETAGAFGIVIAGPEEVRSDLNLTSAPEEHPGFRPFEALLSDWLPLTYALNAVNRSMGHADLYPFTLAPLVVEKLSFVHARVLTVAIAGPLAGKD